MSDKKRDLIIGILATIGVFILTLFLMANTAHAAPYDKPLPVLTMDPGQKTYLSGNQIETLIKDTKLSGLGEAFAKGEAESGINALFVLAIVAHESARGGSDLANRANNLGGIKKWPSGEYRSFESKEDCIIYMYDLLDRLYIAKGRDTVESISKVYCVPPEHWEESINNIMNDYIESLSITRD
jgi:hypothetical protein